MIHNKLQQMLFTIRTKMAKTSAGEPLNLWVSEIPDDYLSCWLVPDIEKYKPYFFGRRSLLNLMNDIPLMIFIYAYGGHRCSTPATDLSDEERAWMYFCQYQKLLYNASFARCNGIVIRDFRIFDFDRYHDLLLQTQADLSVS